MRKPLTTLAALLLGGSAYADFMTVFLTVSSGVLTFVLGQLLLKLVIDPVQELKKTVAEIAYVLIEHANIYANPGVAGEDNKRKVSAEFRKLSSKLSASMHLVPVYAVTAKILGLPSQGDVGKAMKDLIGLSNGLDAVNVHGGILNRYAAQCARDALRIYVPEDERLDPERVKAVLAG